MIENIANLCLVVDIAKNVLLKRMEREAKIVLNDTFLSEDRRLAGFTLYHEVGSDFVEYIKSFHVLRSPKSLLAMAQIAIGIFQDNLNCVWALSYNPKFETRLRICWLSEVCIARELDI